MQLIEKGDLSRLREPVASQVFKVQCMHCGATVGLEHGDLTKDCGSIMDFGGPKLSYECPYCYKKNWVKQLSVPQYLHPEA